ncbi:type II toxin-antitoxin system RelE/ParE family toxin [Pseudomonas sp. 30_B]|uniref:type II toxin-antitoxin system RelE family toxin n=1 Tax=Pseudomonas sp. 30_B TaxID=2813575 RepID=UPI001A9FE916|nr:type II toxin-antitoxin system RelE/ParE family toxin [Pseudomonas sp. 30_B]
MPEFRLEFETSAQREWKKLDQDIRRQFTRKLAERLVHPRVQADKLHGMKDCYKIKLSSAGYRLVYRVEDDRVVVLVLAVGKRERSAVYETAKKR